MSDFKNRIGTAHSLLASLERKHDEELEDLRKSVIEECVEAVGTASVTYGHAMKTAVEYSGEVRSTLEALKNKE